MPKLELPLVSAAGDSDLREIMMVQAIMHAPGNQKAEMEWRTNYYSIKESLRLCQSNTREWDYDYVKKILANAAVAPASKLIMNEATVRANKARMSAKLLYYHALYHLNPLPNNAHPPKFELTQEIIRKANSRDNGKNISSSVQLANWKQFKSVAHLWSAEIINGVASQSKGLPLRAKTFTRFLAIADIFAKFAMTFRPLRQRSMLIPEDGLWQIPQHMLTDQSRADADKAIREFFN